MMFERLDYFDVEVYIIVMLVMMAMEVVYITSIETEKCSNLFFVVLFVLASRIEQEYWK